MTAGNVVDSHVHLWDPSRLDYAWLAGSVLERAFGAEDLLRAADGHVDTFVVVQADCAPEQALAEVDWIAGQWRHRPNLLGVVAFAPVEQGRDAGARYRRLSTYAPVVGVRRLLQDTPPGFGREPHFLAGLETLGELGLPFDVCVREAQLREVIEIVRRVPGVRFVLDHLGKPRVGEADEGWRGDLAVLAALPNVVCKLSGLTTEAIGQPWSTKLVRPYLRHALDVFGPDRCMFGTDWPVLTTASTYPRWLDAVLDALDGFSPRDVDQVLSRTARSVYTMSRADTSSSKEMC